MSARVSALGRQADGLDEHWTVDFARQGETVVHALRAKHPRAHEVSPIKITLAGSGPPAPDLAQAVRRSLGFGLQEEVVLPREAVESLTVSGPAWLSGVHRDVEVRWQPAETAALAETAVEVVFLDGEHVTTRYPGTLSHVGRGSVGRSVTVDLAGGSMQLMIPAASGTPATLRFTFSLEKLEPSAVLRLLRIHERIAAGGAFEVRASAGAIRGGDLPPGPETARQEAARLAEYLQDLDVVQRHCEQYFLVPAELTPTDRISLRMARLLIQGHCVISPFLPRARFTLNGQDSPAPRALLSGEPHAIQSGTPTCVITVAGWGQPAVGLPGLLFPTLQFPPAALAAALAVVAVPPPSTHPGASRRTGSWVCWTRHRPRWRRSSLLWWPSTRWGHRRSALSS
ncbi:hypothetical protein ACWD00_34560 [Streptomyces viridiviolaceus]